MFKKLVFGTLMFGLVAASQAEELFPDAKLKPMKSGDAVSPGDTVGGYPIYTAGAKWTFIRGGVTTSSRGTPLGNVVLTYDENATPIAVQYIDVAIATNDGGYWNGAPCGGDHLVMINKARGKEDHCLTIDALPIQMATSNLTVLNIKITNTASASRMYNVTLQFRPDAFGWRGSNAGDWAKEAVDAQPMRKEFITKLTAWSEKLLDANIRAIDYSKPQDIYENIPSPMSLLLTCPLQTYQSKVEVLVLGSPTAHREAETAKAHRG